jgi:hypothetical protein
MMLGMAFYSNANSYLATTVDGSIEVELSCGISGTLSWTGNPTTAQVIAVVEALEDALC